MARARILEDRGFELTLGAVLFIVSSWMIWDAYEGRGKQRPFAARFLP